MKNILHEFVACQDVKIRFHPFDIHPKVNCNNQSLNVRKINISVITNMNLLIPSCLKISPCYKLSRSAFLRKVGSWGFFFLCKQLIIIESISLNNFWHSVPSLFVRSKCSHYLKTILIEKVFSLSLKHLVTSTYISRNQPQCFARVVQCTKHVRVYVSAQEGV